MQEHIVLSWLALGALLVVLYFAAWQDVVIICAAVAAATVALAIILDILGSSHYLFQFVAFGIMGALFHICFAED